MKDMWLPSSSLSICDQPKQTNNNKNGFKTLNVKAVRFAGLSDGEERELTRALRIPVEDRPWVLHQASSAHAWEKTTQSLEKNQLKGLTGTTIWNHTQPEWKLPSFTEHWEEYSKNFCQSGETKLALILNKRWTDVALLPVSKI